MGKATVSGGAGGLYSATLQIDDGHTEAVSAYCADLSESLSGEVGTIEIAADRSKGVNIVPGFSGDAAYNAARDGNLYRVPQKGGSQPASGVYFNWALRPGAAKWRPNYRYGTISNIDHDANTADVALEACIATDTPDGQELDCNQTASLSGVEFEYMSCNSAAFDEGDDVIVKFEGNNWANPKVIGFKDNPKGCGWSETWEDGICGQHKWSTNNGPCVEIATYAYVSGDMLHVATKGGAIAVYYSSDDDNDLPPPIVGFLRILIPEASAGNYSGIYITAGGTKIYLKCAGSDPYPYFPTTDIGFSSEEMEIDLSTCGLNVGDTITDIRISASGKNLTWPAYQASTITIGYMIFSQVSSLDE